MALLREDRISMQPSALSIIDDNLIITLSLYKAYMDHEYAAIFMAPYEWMLLIDILS